MASSSILNRRIQYEINKLTNDPDVKSYFHYEDLGYKGNDQNKIICIYGYILPQNFPYKYGSFKIKIKLPPEFPFRMPEIIFITPIYHLQTIRCGTELHGICCSECENWSPSKTLPQLIKTVVDRIDRTVATKGSNFRNSEEYSHYMRDQDDYWKTVMNTIEKHAYRRTDEPVMSLKFMAKRIIRAQIRYDSGKINQLHLPITLEQYLQIPFDHK